MKIGELAQLSGISAHTLRFYEKNGLLKASGRSESNYRIYTNNDLQSARFIKKAREIDFSLDDIKVLLSIRADKPSHICADAKQVTQQKISEVESQISKLQEVLAALHRLSDSCCGGNESAEFCSILEAMDSSTNTPTNLLNQDANHASKQPSNPATHASIMPTQTTSKPASKQPSNPATHASIMPTQTTSKPASKQPSSPATRASFMPTQTTSKPHL